MPADLLAITPTQPFSETLRGLATREVMEPDVFRHFFGSGAVHLKPHFRGGRAARGDTPALQGPNSAPSWPRWLWVCCRHHRTPNTHRDPPPAHRAPPD